VGTSAGVPSVNDAQLDQLGPQLLAWLGGFNAVDVVLAVFVGLYALDGIRRGFIAGALGLAGTFLTLVIAAATFQMAAVLLTSYVNLPSALANVAGFFVVLSLAQIVVAIAVKLILVAIAPVKLLLAPVMVVDHALGVVPGVVQAAIIATLVLMPLRLMTFVPQIQQGLAGSLLAEEIPRRVTAFTPQVQTLLGQVASDRSAFASFIVNPDEEVKVPRQASVRADPDAEARMLELVNAERAKAGLRPVVADTRLRDVARLHSEEMFALGYFSHTSPVQGTPVDRLRRGGVPFRLSGENLAYAPTVEIAHAGLMASPGHRANILTPEYTRVGIGVMSAGIQGRMFTQNFAA
jgi:uncharacterized protein YkwD